MTDTTFKKYILDNHNDKYYSQNELIKILNNTKEYTTNKLLSHVYQSKDKKFYFNADKIQTKQRGFEQIIRTHVTVDKKLMEQQKDDEDSFDLLIKKSQTTCTLTEQQKDDDEDSFDLLIKSHSQSVSKLKVDNYKTYSYPMDGPYVVKKNTNVANGPYGTQHYHDEQVDDDVSSDVIRDNGIKFDKLRAIILPEQRSQAWFNMRNNKITASDGATALGLNPYQGRYSFIMKKVLLDGFKGNEACYHGKKYEEVATQIYEYRMNIQTEEFGLIGHKTYDYLGASPDRICGHYKLDNIHKTKYVGRMLEIKCPMRRKIKHDGEIIDNICPLYYWIQVQLQLECCDLDECDFWQCEIKEYTSRDYFIGDTDANEPFRSKYTGFEKSCLIELMPKFKTYTETTFKDAVYDDATFIYPPKIEMTPYECDMWVSNTIADIPLNDKYKGYYVNRVVYWKLVTSNNVTIKRDKEWFNKMLPILKQTWDYVVFFRQNKKPFDEFMEYFNKETTGYNMDKLDKTKAKELDKKMMDYIDKLYNANIGA